MAYIANSDQDRAKMLTAIGVGSIQELFDDIPKSLRFPELGLPAPYSELDCMAELESLAVENLSTGAAISFLGAGAWNHFIPSVVPFLAGRGEFATAYTPYQAEASQGTLQSVFEYQSMISELIGMEVVNASHYDGSTSLAEAAMMSVNVSRGKRKKVLVSGGVHPEYRRVMQTYLQAMEVELLGINESSSPSPEAFLEAGGNPASTYAGDPRAEVEALAKAADENTACVVVSSPDFFGRVIDLDGIAEQLKPKGVLLVVNTEPISLAVFRDPGSYGADIVTGEGQPLGIDLSYGGPYLGIFGTRKDLVRKMPGRLAGATVDTEGSRGFVLTLNTREQHIRRDKATSNICTNQALMALRAAIYLTAMGPEGLKRVAEICYHRSHYAAERINELPGYSVPDLGAPVGGAQPQSVFFKEFVVRTPRPAKDLINELAEEGIIPGLDLGRYFPGRRNELLIAVTEMNSRLEIDALVEALEEQS
ncbi:MAG: aminomethyl-transferring glycine dehydrogenase subunit GcvPA [Spirochaetaceae bacterium]|nr:MAG: aminomethyl-transferring glycine dehydrogenase subunit GcvPA [Spirochaetaceae bacterium]